MPRVKGGYTTRRRRKAVLKLAKGYYGSKHTLYKTAHEQVMRSLAYAYRDRKARKRDFRKLWISRINAACQLNGLKYSRFINGLATANITINRKMLAEMAVNDAEGFAALCKTASEALSKGAKTKAKENVVVLKPLAKNK
ncbi:MAG: 50S ribosomal protein L20 [Anaeroplasmataceae bacterium]|nr:50S ribosomal protein L20 [Anaeroplasmataceae bacterium]